MITYVQVFNRPNYHSRKIKLAGLNPQMQYRNEETGEVFHGDTLLNAGIMVPGMWGDYQSKLIHLKAVQK